MKRGFTLVELLAVIIILAIIALIATPIVSDVIATSKKEALKDSAYKMIEATTTYSYENPVSEDSSNEIDLLDGTLKYTGVAPEKGKVQYDSDGNIRIYMYRDGYCANKGYNYDDITITKMAEENCNYSAGRTIDIVDNTTINSNKEITLENYTIAGNSYQEVRSGKNLFDETKYDEISEYTSASPYSYAEIQLESDTTYKVSIKRYNGFDGSGKGYLLLSDRQSINGTTWTSIAHLSTPDKSYTNYEYKTGSTGIIYIGYLMSSMTQENLSYIWANTDVQIEKGTDATSYEPYGVMPSPQFPSEIKTLGRYNSTTNKYDIDVKLTGKNLLSKFQFVDNYYNDENEYSDLISISTGQSITFSFDSTSASSYRLIMRMYDQNKNLITNNNNTNMTNMSPYFSSSEVFYMQSNSATITFTGNKDSSLKKVTITANNNIYLSFGFKWGDTSSSTIFINPMVEYGTEFTSYEPYSTKTTTISLDEPLRCLGDICDYIDYISKKIVRKVAREEFDENSYWEQNTPTDYQLYYHPLNNFNKKEDEWSDISCTHYNNVENESHYGVSLGFYANVLYLNYGTNTNVSNLKGWLGEQKTAGTPMTIYYELATPTETTISLPKIKLPAGDSKIIVTDGELNAKSVTIVK